MRTLIATCIAVSLLAGTIAASAQCAPRKVIRIWGSLTEKPKVAKDYNPESVVIGVGNYALFELKTGAAGYTLAEREVTLYNRIIEILSYGPVNPESIKVCYTRSSPSIFVGPYLLMTAYAKDAAVEKTTQDALAERWRKRLAEVLPKVAPEDTVAKSYPAPKTPAPAPTVTQATPVQPAVVTPQLTPTTPPTTAPVETAPAGEIYEVGIGGVLLFRLRDKDGYPSLEARGAATEAAITEVLSHVDATGRKAEAVSHGDVWDVNWDGVRVVRVHPLDAKASGLGSTAALAQAWAKTLNDALPRLMTGKTTN